MGGCGANAINDTELDELLAKWTAPPAPLLCATRCEQNSRRASRVGSGRARHKREGECLWGHAWRRSTPIGLWPKRGRDRHRSEFPKSWITNSSGTPATDRPRLRGSGRPIDPLERLLA